MWEIKQEFSERERRWFGPLFALYIVIVAGFVRRWLPGGPTVGNTCALLLLTAGLLLIVVYYLRPAWQLSIYRGWMKTTAPFGYVVLTMLLAAVYLLVVTPIGLVRQWSGRDPLRLRKLPAGASYWIPRCGEREASDYYRQF